MCPDEYSLLSRTHPHLPEVRPQDKSRSTLIYFHLTSQDVSKKFKMVGDPAPDQHTECSYEYGPLNPHHIRVLRLNASDHLELSIEIVDLDSNPEYVALSYAWEGQVPRHRITCGSSSYILVTDSVLSMLKFWHSARDEHGAPPIWIDAVCINQSDTCEKSAQVQLMSRIYSQARQVWISLGDGNELLEMVVEHAAAIRDLIQVIHVTIQTGTPFDLNQIPGPHWVGLGDLFMAPWFNRVWTMQEAILASDLRLRVGAKSCGFGLISQVAEAAIKLHFVEILYPHGRTQEGEPETMHFNAAFRLAMMIRHARLWPDELTGPDDPQLFWIWLRLSRGKLCSDPRDRIFGLLGVVPAEIRLRVTVDYALSFGEVSERFARACVEVFGPEMIMYHCRATDPVPECPSWVPNLAADMTLQWFENNPAFCASGDSEMCHRLLGVDDGHRLVLRGYVVDEVKIVGPSCMPWATRLDPDWESNTREIRDSDPDWAFDNLDALFQVTMPKETSDAILKFEEECLALARSAYADEDAALKAHFATLTAEMPNTHPGMPPWTIETYYAWKKHCLYQDPCKADVLEYWRPRGDRTAIVNLMCVSEMVEQNLRHRAYFSTARGRVGLGSSLVQTGDLVCVFKGFRTPFLLRGTARDGRYRLMDEAYVHGIMYGETEQSETGDVDFEIE